jgi:hypothetical protein
MSLEQKKIIIAGGSRFLGISLANYLVEPERHSDTFRGRFNGRPSGWG